MTEKMTREAATSFERYSGTHAEILAEVANLQGCQCVAYRDWFTYRRWQAQGMQVQKGQHGVKLTTWIPVTKIDNDGEKKVVGKRPRGASVFCRCQVKAID